MRMCINEPGQQRPVVDGYRTSVGDLMGVALHADDQSVLKEDSCAGVTEYLAVIGVGRADGVHPPVLLSRVREWQCCVGLATRPSSSNVLLQAVDWRCRLSRRTDAMWRLGRRSTRRSVKALVEQALSCRQHPCPTAADFVQPSSGSCQNGATTMPTAPGP